MLSFLKRFKVCSVHAVCSYFVLLGSVTNQPLYVIVYPDNSITVKKLNKQPIVLLHLFTDFLGVNALVTVANVCFCLSHYVTKRCFALSYCSWLSSSASALHRMMSPYNHQFHQKAFLAQFFCVLVQSLNRRGRSTVFEISLFVQLFLYLKMTIYKLVFEKFYIENHKLIGGHFR